MASSLSTNGMQRKADRRVSRTRQALRQALYDLVKERGYDAVTIEDITERADVGRTTFYLHFRDKDDLLLDQFKEQIDSVFLKIAEFPASAWINGFRPDFFVAHPLRPLVMLFEHFAEYNDLYQILKNSGTLKLSSILNTLLSNAVIQTYTKITEREQVTLDAQVPIEILAHYFSGALMGTVFWWLSNGQPYPPQQMARMFQRMFAPGARRALGLPGDRFVQGLSEMDS